MDVLRLRGCKTCNEIKRSLLSKESKHKNFLEKFKKSNGNDEYELLSKYKRPTNKIKLRHKVCSNEYWVAPYHFLNGTRCPKCRNKRLDHEDFVLKYSHILRDYEILSRFTRMSDKILLKHKRCGHKFYSKPTKFVNRGDRCPNCSHNSKLSAKVEAVLVFNNKNYKKEHFIKGCKYKNLLKFDFVIFDDLGNIEIIIECDGEQHFNENLKFFHKDIPKRDKIKNSFCKNNGIKLLRINFLQIEDVYNILHSNVKNIDKIPPKSLFHKYLSKKSVSLEEKFLIIELYIKGGLSSHKIAEKFNISKTYVLSILKDKTLYNDDVEDKILNKLKSRERLSHKYDHLYDKFFYLRSQGLSLREIGRLNGCSHGQVKKCLERFKKKT